ncbi:MAG: LysR family transcriptional regulator [Lachnospiraceae bacterium]|nr:LysR family transcriptional regulator [Candidatus Minthocola equi]
MNIQQLYYFEAVARLQNYTKAAEELMTTQSCLGHSISDLENELGMKLLIYHNRQMILTPFGDLFLSHVKKILGELTLIEDDKREATRKNNEPLRIAFVSNMSHEWIPNLVKEFTGIPGNEDIEFIFTETIATKLAVQELRSNNLDLFFGAKLDGLGVDSYFIYDEDLFAIVPPDSAFAKQSVFNLDDLKQTTLVTYNTQCGTRFHVDNLLSDYNVTPAKIIETATEKMMASAVSSNLGVAILPYFREIDYFNVKILPLNASRAKRPIHMMWLPEKYNNPLVRSFISFVKVFCEK